jgi:outer membrane protein assembly factor BamE (lipoprotein component of BamABCDE complex)
MKLIILLTILVTSCTNNYSYHGNRILKEDDLQIIPGKSKKDIANLLGSPSFRAIRDNKEIWFYFDYSQNKRPLRKKKITSYKIIELVFDKNKISKIEKFNFEEDYQKIAFSKTKTPTGKAKTSVIKDILKNIGRFEGSNDL